MTIQLITKYPLLSAIALIFLSGAVTWLFNEWRFQKRLNWKQTIDNFGGKLDDLTHLIENLFKKYSGHEKRIDRVEEKQSAVMARIDAVEERCDLHRDFTRMKGFHRREEDPEDKQFKHERKENGDKKDGT